MEIYVKISFISIFYLFFWFSNMILYDTLNLLISQLQTQQVMTLPIRSHTEYLTQTYVLVLTFQSKLIKNLALIVGLIRFNDDT